MFYLTFGHILRSRRNSILLFALIVISLATWAVSWRSCMAPWVTECFTHGGWGDYKLHYYSWIAYVNNSSFIPPSINSFTWPYETSLMYTDSMPLFAIFFKPFACITGFKSWQYFSFASLINSLLIAICLLNISLHLQWKVSTTISAGFFLITNPISYIRLFLGHESLQIHSPLVIAITLLILNSRRIWMWYLLIFVSVGINPYIAMMVFIASSLANVTSYRCIIRPISHCYALIVHILLAVIIFSVGAMLFGYSHDSSFSGSDIWGANMLSFLDPQNYSSFISPIRKREPFETEGFSYLGVGGCLLAFYALTLISKPRRASHIVPLTWYLYCLLMLLFSFGYQWNIADLPLDTSSTILRIPGIGNLYSIFRSSGRFTWPSVYTILLSSLHILDKYRHRQPLVLLTLLQLLEINFRVLVRVGDNFNHRIYSQKDPIPAWVKRNSSISKALSNADLVFVGQHKNHSDPIPGYAFLKLNHSVVANGSAPEFTRLPNSYISSNSNSNLVNQNYSSLVSYINTKSRPSIVLLQLSEEEMNSAMIICRRFKCKLSRISSNTLGLQF